MNVRVLLIVFLSLLSAYSFSENCGYVHAPEYIKIDNSIDAQISVSIANINCSQALLSLRIHTHGKKSDKPLYVMDNSLGAFFGSRAISPTKPSTQLLANELLREVTDKKIVGNFDAGYKCLHMVPEAYLNKLKAENKDMLSYRWRANEIRYLAYIQEIEQIVVIAQCSKIR
jgi:hypothetical protein